jgi:Na+/H+-dicarboxylate symporter/ABC-type amino acid transport substrate-binding protein
VSTSSEARLEERVPPEKGRRRLPSLSTQVLLALVLGVAAGIFFGEMMASIRILGEVFIGLLQMTVLPYILLSLILGLGRLSFAEARLLAAKGGLYILVFWVIGLGVIAAMTLAFPDWESASFFSTSLVASGEDFDFVDLYVPANPFYSLTNGIVPAVVVFSLAIGLALIGIPSKGSLLDNLAVFNDAVMRVAQAVVQLAPIGVFALVGAAAGTIGGEELGRLQVYILAYIGAALLLTFWILPGLVSALTDISYGRVLGATKDPLITAFATGNLLIVLPLLSERIKELLIEANLHTRDTDSAADLIVPINFNLPNLGKLLALGFVPFAGWFAGSPVALEQFPLFLVSGLFSFFGEVVVAMPFLLDLMRIPADMFQVFLAVDVFTGRFGTLLAGVHTVALTLLAAAAVTGAVRLRPVAIGRYLLIALVACVAVFGGLRLFFEHVVPYEYREYEALVEMDALASRVPVTLRDLTDLGALSAQEKTRDRVAVIQARGSLRVGYVRDSLPFIYRNAEGRLVGLEVDLAHVLARDLGVALELVRLERDAIAQALREGRIDIAMGGLFITPERVLRFHMSEPYTEGTLSLVVPDHRRSAFRSTEDIRAMKGLRVAAVDIPYYVNMIDRYLPDAEVIVIDTPRDFFKDGGQRYDALLFSAEAGSAWTLVYPQFSVVVPDGRRIKAPVAFGLAPDTPRLERYVNTWVSLKRQEGTVEVLFDHWILGKGAEGKTPRWSVIRDVLGWVD